MPLKADTVLANRYVITRTIKAGGMGAVYEAVDKHLAHTPCAVKEMLEQFLEEEQKERAFVERCFAEEMRFLATLSHGGIPQVRDSFTLEGRAYIVMELVQGDNLEVELAKGLTRTGKPFSAEAVVRDALAGLEVLKYLHAQDPPVLHRDVKPANMVRDEASGAVKLVDFGLVRSWSRSNSTQTSVGTLAYAPLEQLQGHAEPRSDLYSLGATMYHLLTGKPPQPLHPAPLRQSAPQVDRRLAAIVDRAMAERPDRRYVNATAMQEALMGWLAWPTHSQACLPGTPGEVAQEEGGPTQADPVLPTFRVEVGADVSSAPPTVPATVRPPKGSSGEWSAWLAQAERARTEGARRQRPTSSLRLGVAVLTILVMGALFQGLATQMASGAPEPSPALIYQKRGTHSLAQSAGTGHGEASSGVIAAGSCIGVGSATFASATLEIDGRTFTFTMPSNWWLAQAEAEDAGARLVIKDNLQRRSLEIHLAVVDASAAAAFEQQMLGRWEQKGWKREREIREGNAPTQYVLARPVGEKFEPLVVLTDRKSLSTGRTCCVVSALDPGLKLGSGLEPDAHEIQELHHTLQEMCKVLNESVANRL